MKTSKNPLFPKNIVERNNKNRICVCQNSPSPERQILRMTKDVSVMCFIPEVTHSQEELLTKKKDHVQALKKIIENQEKLMASYLREIESKRSLHQNTKTKTLQSTSRMALPIERTSYKIMPSPGSIIKIRRP